MSVRIFFLIDKFFKVFPPLAQLSSKKWYILITLDILSNLDIVIIYHIHIFNKRRENYEIFIKNKGEACCNGVSDGRNNLYRL